jgi:hypothetical protein
MGREQQTARDGREKFSMKSETKTKEQNCSMKKKADDG